MIEQETPPCALGLADETLSALRDDTLPGDEARRIHEHTATCAACRHRLDGFTGIANLLRAQPELEPGDRIWRGVRERAMGTTNRQRVHRFGASSSAVGRPLAAVASIVLVVGLLAAVLASASAGRPGASLKPTQPVPTDIGKPTFAPTATPAFPTPTLPPTSPAISAMQAWGTSAVFVTVNTQLDATHAFWATAISPDGTRLLGANVPPASPGQQPSGEAGAFTIATRQFTSTGLSQVPFYAVGCCQTDGRYLLIQYDTAPGATCGSCHLTYYSYDMSTQTLWQIAKGTDYGGIFGRSLNHGLVLLGTAQGIMEANPATRTITPLQLPVASGDEVLLGPFAWPYVAYTVTSSGGAGQSTHAHNLETNQDIALPHVDAIGGGEMVIAGDTLFIAHAIVNDPRANVWVTSLYEDDSFFSPSATPRLLASYADELRPAGANDRLVAFRGGIDYGVVWDRAEQRFVRITPPPPSGYSTSVLEAVSLAGHFLAVMQPLDPNGGSGAQQVTIYDTTSLRTTPST